jgi:hypothetical protein
MFAHYFQGKVNSFVWITKRCDIRDEGDNVVHIRQIQGKRKEAKQVAKLFDAQPWNF